MAIHLHHAFFAHMVCLLLQPAHSVVSEVSMTSFVVLGRGRDRGVDELLAQLKAFTFRF